MSESKSFKSIRVLPPEASMRGRRLVRMLSRPLEKFLHIEASSGIILLVMALIALVWANSPWASSYHNILHSNISIGFGDAVFSKSVHFWINEILMVVFFLVVGLEVRRELFEGELSTPRRATLPVMAALGGMLVPAVIYLVINAGSPTISGWGTPMATDIAFAVGILALLGSRVPAALRVLLLAIAIIDDIGAILVIALFYSSGLAWAGLAIAVLAIAVVVAMQRLGVRNPFLYVVPGVLLWAGLFYAGIHPTIAGVIVGLLTPVRPWFGQSGFVDETKQALHTLEDVSLQGSDQSDTDSAELRAALARVSLASREAVPPVTRIETALHPWVAFIIMPLFALANAGVSLGGLGGSTDALIVILGVGVGLVVGKPLGIVLFSGLAVRLGWASLPRGVSWTGVLVVGCVAGIGFTMALFIGALAFSAPETLAVAKLAVLIASAIAGVAGLAIGFRFLPRAQTEGAKTPSEAEASTLE